LSEGAAAPAIDWAALSRAAREVRARAYAPYSGFTVGAALLAEDGRVFVGANVENASYGLCLCAERSAIGSAIAAGAARFRAIAIASPGDTPASPCGMCRQVLAEFPPSFPIRCYAERGEPIEMDVAGALPGAFGPAVLERGRSKP
jgi:cytidine deaminase